MDVRIEVPTSSIERKDFRARFYLRYIAIQAMLIKGTVVHLFTGGDDNAVHLNEVTFGTNITCKPLASVLNAHTSTITGVLILGNGQYLSVGSDQRIRIWEFDGAKLICLYSGYTFGPDVCGVVEIGVRLGKRRFVVFGTGMEMIAWDGL